MNTTSIRSRLFTLLRKSARNLLIALVIALPIRQGVAMPVRVTTDSVAPELPKGSRALVSRLASDFRPGDIIAYKADSKVLVARFDSAISDVFHVSRNHDAWTIARSSVVGKVVASTR